jgi:acyl-CoA synthetase (AMP-forming)/AMP-acid ligase II
VLVIVKKPGAELSEGDVKAYLADKIAKWWMPDRVLFADDLPHTGTGKILKTELRARYKDLQLEG